MKDMTLNQREQTRLHVLNTVLEHQLPVSQAAEIMRVSERHAWRTLAAYRQEGAAALAHGNRGRRPRNAVSDAEAAAVVQLATTTYAGANQTHFAELLRDREGIDLSRRTVHRILTRAGIPSPRKRRPPRHRVRRKRMPQEGMLVQVDGSYHPWLGDGRPPLHPAPGGGRCHRHCGQRGVSPGGGHPGLLRPDGGVGPALGRPPGPLRRSPRRLQVFRKAPPHPAAGGSHPLQPGHGGNGHTADLRPLASGQRPGGTHGGDFSGPAGDRTTLSSRQNH